MIVTDEEQFRAVVHGNKTYWYRGDIELQYGHISGLWTRWNFAFRPHTQPHYISEREAWKLILEMGR